MRMKPAGAVIFKPGSTFLLYCNCAERCPVVINEGVQCVTAFTWSIVVIPTGGGITE